MDSSRIFVKGLPPTITEAEFRKHFSAKNREITDIKLISQRRIGYVGYKTIEDASSAVKYFHKSYIRMSKISVEPAKSVSGIGCLSRVSILMNYQISDPTLPKGARAPHATHAWDGSKTVKKSPEEDLNPNKRKREEPDQSNPRLQEFIRIMKPGKAGVLADESNPGINAGFASTNPVVEEAESDDEYEHVPARKEKMRKTGSSEMSQHGTASRLTAPKEGISEHSDSAAVPEQKTEPMELDKTATSQAVDATDDDWLRSRTNRLLDLVEPEDLPQASTSAPAGQAEVRNTEDGVAAPVSSNEATPADNGGEKYDQDIAHPETGDAIGTIMRTARLFLRNLSYSTTERDLHEEFEKFGSLQEVRFCTFLSALPFFLSSFFLQRYWQRDEPR